MFSMLTLGKMLGGRLAHQDHAASNNQYNLLQDAQAVPQKNRGFLFHQVADSGSFGKAAEAMYISTPAIIQQVNLLEEHCGFQLFSCSNHGVKLTPAGKSLYEDALTLIRLSEDALNKAKQLAETSENTVRIGTSLLYKCRLLELSRTPICCAVSKNHRFAKEKILRLQDLNGEYLVMPIAGVSQELDAFRNEISQNYPTTQIIDSSYYGVDTFTLCEVNPYILITQPVYSDIHTNLITIHLDTEYTMPYGLIYANEPTVATKKFIEAVKKTNQIKKC